MRDLQLVIKSFSTFLCLFDFYHSYDGAAEDEMVR